MRSNFSRTSAWGRLSRRQRLAARGSGAGPTLLDCAGPALCGPPLHITSAGEGGNAPQLDTRAPQRELPAGVSAGRAGMDGVEAQLTVERGGAANYVYGARAARDFGDGFVAVLLPVYLAAIGLAALKIGLVATLALLGSASMTRGIGRLGARLCHYAAQGRVRADGRDRSRLRAVRRLCHRRFGGMLTPSIRPPAASAFSCLSSTPSSPAPRQLADRTRMLARY
jgi:hypothetical protein